MYGVTGEKRPIFIESDAFCTTSATLLIFGSPLYFNYAVSLAIILGLLPR
jgi:hypothetical protein